MSLAYSSRAYRLTLCRLLRVQFFTSDITKMAISQPFIGGFGWNFDTGCKKVCRTKLRCPKWHFHYISPSFRQFLSPRIDFFLSRWTLRASNNHENIKKSKKAKRNFVGGPFGSPHVKFQPDPSINGWDIGILVNSYMFAFTLCEIMCVIIKLCSSEWNSGNFITKRVNFNEIWHAPTF
jgi:hypothetical protein